MSLSVPTPTPLEWNFDHHQGFFLSSPSFQAFTEALIHHPWLSMPLDSGSISDTDVHRMAHLWAQSTLKHNLWIAQWDYSRYVNMENTPDLHHWLGLQAVPPDLTRPFPHAAINRSYTLSPQCSDLSLLQHATTDALTEYWFTHAQDLCAQLKQEWWQYCYDFCNPPTPSSRLKP